MRVFEPDNDDAIEPDDAWKDYVRREGLKATDDSSHDKPIYRREGFEGIKSVEEIDERIAKFIRKARERAGLLQNDVSSLLGLSVQVYGRYERNKSAMSVSRLVIMSELLGYHPAEMIYYIAPHLWGETEELARMRADLALKIAQLPQDVIEDLVPFIDKMIELNKYRQTKKRD